MSWRDPGGTLEERARSLVADVGGRGEIKRLGAWLDQPDNAELRRAVRDEGRRLGVDLPEDADTWAGKRLLRLARGREDSSQVVGTLTRLDEAFVCAWCGHAVPPHGRTARDHCPRCLRGLHVDVVPGDRAADCGGLLQPTFLSLNHGEPVIHYRCARCAVERVNRALTDGDEPDDPGQLRALSAGALK